MSQELIDMLNAALNFGEKSTKEDQHASVVIATILGASVNDSLPKLSTLCLDFMAQELIHAAGSLRQIRIGNQLKGN